MNFTDPNEHAVALEMLRLERTGDLDRHKHAAECGLAACEITAYRVVRTDNDETLDESESYTDAVKFCGQLERMFGYRPPVEIVPVNAR